MPPRHRCGMRVAGGMNAAPTGHPDAPPSLVVGAPTRPPGITAPSPNPVVAVPGAGAIRVANCPCTIKKNRSFGGRGTRPFPPRHWCGMRIAGGMHAAPALVRDAGRGRHECRPYARGGLAAAPAYADAAAPWHFLYFFPDPQGQWSLRPTVDQSTGARGPAVTSGLGRPPAATSAGSGRATGRLLGGSVGPMSTGPPPSFAPSSGPSTGISSSTPSALYRLVGRALVPPTPCPLPPVSPVPPGPPALPALPARPAPTAVRPSPPRPSPVPRPTPWGTPAGAPWPGVKPLKTICARRKRSVNVL